MPQWETSAQRTRHRSPRFSSLAGGLSLRRPGISFWPRDYDRVAAVGAGDFRSRPICERESRAFIAPSDTDTIVFKGATARYHLKLLLSEFGTLLLQDLEHLLLRLTIPSRTSKRHHGHHSRTRDVTSLQVGRRHDVSNHTCGKEDYTPCSSRNASVLSNASRATSSTRSDATKQ